MKAMILAAGRGERMRPLTDHCPKPLLKVAGIPLIEHHINKLVQCGITDIIINFAWLGEMISSYLGDGKKFGANISYSAESNGALETAGGIIQALPLLTKNSNNSEPFVLINGDIFTDYSFADIPILADNYLAHICLVNNPQHNKDGDFIFNNNRLKNINPIKCSELKSECTYTFSGISIFRPEFFKGENTEQMLKLGPMIKKAVNQGKVSANLLDCAWTDVGTPDRLENLNK